MIETALFIFRRDLRLEDNLGLLFAASHAKIIIPAFIFTPEQIENNPYKGERSLQFLIESLEDLDQALRKKSSKLYLFYGKPEEVLSQCLSDKKIDAVIVNCDYTPYSIKRDKQLEKVCKEQDVTFHSFDDLLLHPPEDTLKADGKPYTIFTPFYKNALHLKVPKPSKLPPCHFFKEAISGDRGSAIYKKLLPKRLEQPRGGREAALKLLQKAAHSPSHLSAHLKFTTCSPREVYHAGREDLRRALCWRDFFSGIAYFFPRVFGHSFHSFGDQIVWNKSQSDFNKWREGKTGFPIVDAAMRELKLTGSISNRMRMIVASFLTKDLLIDWRWGEKHFAQSLIDYDPAVNNGNWQWVASTGCDSQPYFRIFNPWLQQKKFDPKASYIKRWIPELKNKTAQDIHAGKGYLPAMLDHKSAAADTLAAYKKARSVAKK